MRPAETDWTAHRAKMEAEREANLKLKCTKPKCGNNRNRFGNWCDEHWPEVRERRIAGAKKGSATRKANRHLYSLPTPDERWRQKASLCVALAKQLGVLPILDGTIACADCGGVATEYEHRDYARPYDVDPICRSCNLRRGSAAVPQPKQFARIAGDEKKAA